MKKASLHPQEEDRLNIIKSLDILDTKPEQRFDIITKNAIDRLNVPISSIAIIDRYREWFKSKQGLNINESSRNDSFCGHALLEKNLLVIEDTFNDLRFVDNPHVKSHAPIRFYVGVNLKHQTSGLPIGVFCIKDYKPRKLAEDELEIFLELAKEAEYQLNKEKALHPRHLILIARK